MATMIRKKCDELEVVIKQLQNIKKDLESSKSAPPLVVSTTIPEGLTLDDIYIAFGNKKKHYATRLKHAFLEHHIETIEDLMALSISDIVNMDGIGSETLRLLITKLNVLGIEYHPVAKK